MEATIRFRITGPEAATSANELEALLRAELACDAVRVPDTPEAPGTVVRAGDPVAVAALVLSIPGALLAVSDLAQRIELVAKLQRLAHWAQERRRAYGTRVEVIPGEGQVLLLDDAEPGLLIRVKSE